MCFDKIEVISGKQTIVKWIWIYNYETLAETCFETLHARAFKVDIWRIQHDNQWSNQKKLPFKYIKVSSP